MRMNSTCQLSLTIIAHIRLPSCFISPRFAILFWLVCTLHSDKSPLTGYCVEIEKVDLSSLKRTPTTPPSIKPDPRFADYVSCNGQKEKDYK